VAAKEDVMSTSPRTVGADADLAGAHGVDTHVTAMTYTAPELHVVGSAVELVQGGGGMSGSDRNYYYYFLPGE
jgi:hypothetical protein